MYLMALSMRLVITSLKASEKAIPFVYKKNSFMTGSESTVSELAELGLSRLRLCAVPYGVNTALYSPGVKSEWPSILFVGRIKKYKGIANLLSAIIRVRDHIPDIHVDIVGEGDARADLERRSRELGLDDVVKFHGYIDEQSKIESYQRAWIACLPSAKEGFGLTIPEAALCETPTVGYDVAGVRDAIVHGETGLLVPHGNVERLSEAFLTLLCDGELQGRMGRAARARYTEFTWDAAAEMMLEQIDGLLCKHAANTLLDPVLDRLEDSYGR